MKIINQVEFWKKFKNNYECIICKNPQESYDFLSHCVNKKIIAQSVIKDYDFDDNKIYKFHMDTWNELCCTEYNNMNDIEVNNSQLYCDIFFNSDCLNEICKNNTNEIKLINKDIKQIKDEILLKLNRLDKAEKEIVELKNQSKKLNNNKNGEEKRGDCMKMDFKKMFSEFGRIENEELALTLDGKIAIKRGDGEYVRYNKEEDIIENQMDLVIKNANDLIYILPVTEIEEGDIIKNKNSFYQVTDILDNGSLKAVNIKTGVKSNILREKNIMGFSFYYKVTNLMTPQNGNIQGFNPMMLMMMDKDKDKDKDKDSNNDMMDMLLMSQMFGNTQGFNPMMLMMMNKDNDSMIQMMMMMQMMNTQTGACNNLFQLSNLNKNTIENKHE